MAKTIKTKDSVRGIKTLDKGAVAAERMKDAFVRTKDKAEHGMYAEENSPTEYAADQISYRVDDAAREGGHQFNKQGQKAFQETRRNIGKAKDKIQTVKERKESDLPKEKFRKEAARRTAASRPAGPAVERSGQIVEQSSRLARESGKTIKQTGRAAAKTAETTGKGAVKTARRSVKTAQATARTTIKTSQQAAKAAQQTARVSVKAAQRAVQTARAAARAAAAGIKTAAKATAAAVKAIIAGTKALIAAIAAGGWVAVVVILIICLIGLLVGSCFGIFFAGEDSGSGQTMQTAVREINTEYQDRLEEIKNAQSYDVLEMSGSRAVWKEVLAIYAVKTTTDPENAQEVATMDEKKCSF